MAKIDLNFLSTDLSQLSRELSEVEAKARSAKGEADALGDAVGESFGGAAKDAEQFANSMSKTEREMKAISKRAIDLEDEVKQLNRVYKDLNKEQSKFADGSKDYQKIEKEIRKVQGRLSDVKKEQIGLNDEGKKGVGVFKEFGKGLLAAFSVAAIIAAIKGVIDFQKELQKTRKLVNQLTGLTGGALNNITARVKATADTFNRDFNEVLIASNTVAKEFGLTQAESIEKIQQGFLLGADASGEFLDVLREYPAQFQAAGLSADQAIGLITQSVKEGIFSDKGPDVIKEATLRLRELTPAARAALDGIGLSSTQIEKDLASGQTTIFEVIQQVSNRLKELPEQSAAVGTAIADIFGGPGEDAGLRYITLLGDIQGELSNTEDSTNEFQTSQANLLEANEKLEKSFNRLFGSTNGIFDNITAEAKLLLADGINGLIDGVVGTINFFRELYNESLVVRLGFEQIALSAKVGFEIVKFAINTLFDPFKTLGKVISAVFRGDFEEIPKIIKAQQAESRREAKQLAEGVGNAFTTAFKNTVEPKKLDPITLDDNDSEELKKVYKKAGVDSADSFSDAILNRIKQNELKLLQTIQEQAVRLRGEFDAIFPDFDKDAKDRVDAFINQAGNQIDAVAERFAQANQPKPEQGFFARMLGIYDDDIERLKDTARVFLNEVANIFGAASQQRLELAQDRVDEINDRVAEQEDALDREIELAELGFANNVDVQRRTLEETKKQRAKALEEQNKAIKAQQRLETIEQAVSIGTASANILKGFSTLPFIGQVLGAAAVAAMIAGFVSSKAKAKAAAQSFFVGGESGYTGEGNIHHESLAVGRKPYTYHKKEFIFNNEVTKENLPFFRALHKNKLSSLSISDPTVQKVLSAVNLDMSVPDRVEQKKTPFKILEKEVAALRKENSKFHTFMYDQGVSTKMPDGSVEIRKKNYKRVIKDVSVLS